ncbi:hypothetical protein [Haloarcula marina]|uniref:hypothetical protein n=1 Tax=Haloarcula marina TaxID=2961574 RepID=UPI0020B7EE2F|nr:hypothetical protein [Halomicroarcula marina]
MSDSDEVKAALRALADGEESTPGDAAWGETDPVPAPRSEPAGEAGDYRAVIDRAIRATEDVEAAAAFVDSVGLDSLERAVERAEREVSGRAREGRDALAAFQRFRAAAGGQERDG